MKRIFVGSSNEALKHAVAICQELKKFPDIEPVLWSEYFSVGDITFEKIEQLADGIHGAIILATPDDDSVIRGKVCKTPRANVLFEYGYVAAALGRRRVALCRYDETVLPSDFDGLTYVPMGTFDPDMPPSDVALGKLIRWACNDVNCAPRGIGATTLYHALSGEWHYELIFERWRKIDLSPKDFSVGEANLYLSIPVDGRGGTGCAVGRLQVQIGDCYAEFRITDIVREVTCTATGGIIIRTDTHSRQLVGDIVGTPPQKDGYEQSLKTAQSFHLSLEPDPKNPRTLIGTYATHFAGTIYSRGNVKMWR